MPVKVIESSKKGDYWNVVIEKEGSDEIVTLATDLHYREAYQLKLATEKRVTANQLIVLRRPIVTI